MMRTSYLPPPSFPPLTEVNLTGRGTKSVILNSFQDLNFLQIIPHPFPLSYLGEGIRFKQKPAFQSFSKLLEYLIQATAQFAEKMLMQTLCLPLSWICSTLTETRQKACGLVVSFRSLSGLTSCRPYANPLSLTEVNLTGRGNYKLQFIQKPTCRKFYKFLNI